MLIKLLITLPNPEETSDSHYPIFEEIISTPDQIDTQKESETFTTPVGAPTAPSCSSTKTPQITRSCSRMNCVYKRMVEHKSRTNRRLRKKVGELKKTIKMLKHVISITKTIQFVFLMHP
jgi:hypothetical protein